MCRDLLRSRPQAFSRFDLLFERLRKRIPICLGLFGHRKAVTIRTCSKDTGVFTEIISIEEAAAGQPSKQESHTL